MGIINTIKARWKLRRTVFVCSGNTCRSPMAEHLLKAMSIERGLNIGVCSRGIGTSSEFGLTEREGSYATRYACNAVSALYPGAAMALHVPRPLNYHDVMKASIILTMEERHRNHIIANSLRFYDTDVEDRVFTLREYAGFTDGFGIADPMGAGMGFSISGGFTHFVKPDKQRIYNSCRDEIKACLERILDSAMPDVDKLLQERQERQELEELQKMIAKSEDRKE